MGQESTLNYFKVNCYNFTQPEVNLQHKGALKVICDALYGKPFVSSSQNEPRTGINLFDTCRLLKLSPDSGSLLPTSDGRRLSCGSKVLYAEDKTQE